MLQPQSRPQRPACLTARRNLLRGAVLLAVVAVLPVQAHHGWAWAEGENSTLSGRILAVKLGNPHGELTLDVAGVKWTVEVGQPYRHENAGLKDELLAVGTTISVSGHKHADPNKKVLKAERVTIAGKTYNLYPDRD